MTATIDTPLLTHERAEPINFHVIVAICATVIVTVVCVASAIAVNTLRATNTAVNQEVTVLQNQQYQMGAQIALLKGELSTQTVCLENHQDRVTAILRAVAPPPLVAGCPGP